MPFETIAPRARALLLMGVVATAACGDDDGGITGPDSGPVTVTISRVGVYQTGVDDQRQQYITCEVLFRASSEGTESVIWESATLYWYVGADRTLPVDSSFIAASDIWGEPELPPGVPQESRAEIRAGAPFALRATFRYHARPRGSTRSAEASFTCGPEVPSGGTPEPELAGVSIQSLSGALEPGDTIRVRFTASSTIGLWETLVVLRDACELTTLFSEGLAQRTTHDVAIPIPSGCTLGLPLTVGIVALDAALQEQYQVTTLTPALSDLTPPRITVSSSPGTPGVRGTFFAGDTLSFMFEARDNHDVRALIWEIYPAGIRDSLVVFGPEVSPWIAVPLEDAWVGPLELRFYARDATNLTSDTVTTAPGDVQVRASVTLPSVDGTVPGGVDEVLFDVARGVLYALQQYQSRITVLETLTLGTVETIGLPAPAVDLDLTPGGDSLLLTLPALGALGVVDLGQATRQVVVVPLTSLDSALYQRPIWVRAMANGKAFVRLGGLGQESFRLLQVDLASRTETIRLDAGDQGYIGAARMERSADRTVLVLQGGPGLFQRYATATDTFGAPQSATPFDVRPSLDGSGQVTSIGLDLYDTDLRFLREVESKVPPNAAVYVLSALTPSGEYLYQALQPWGILRSRVSDGVLLDRSPSPVDAWNMRISDDGAFLAQVQNTSAGTARIRVVDLR
jgi:hypothetical protein